MEALAATGYGGSLSLEIFNDQFRGGSARSVAIDGQRSLRFLLDQLAARTGKPVAGLPEMPPRASCSGVEFIEFAMEESSVLGFENMLAGLGFWRAGAHKSKSVTRWRQGGINLVVNTEKEGFAHAFNIVHGASVCALGLQVNDAAATFERATSLLDQPFHQAVGPGELQIPAVRGVGGSLLYFLDANSELGRVWDIEFDALGGSTTSDAGLTAIDHVSQSMQYEEMLTWLLFYGSLIDTRKLPVQDVVDPGGLVKSQVVESADGRLRIVLNGSLSQRTQSSRFLSQVFGSGVHHIAFATDDLLQTVRCLERKGVRLLSIPENYYDDLEAKGDLPFERISELKAHNILYERVGDGEYLQAYTEAFEQRFFFEIVERRGGYGGYGAVNAPIRLAAQARRILPDAA
jgi:4-hydroxyphenylpyruvate dioxygenase